MAVIRFSLQRKMNSEPAAVKLGSNKTPAVMVMRAKLAAKTPLFVLQLLCVHVLYANNKLNVKSTCNSI